MQAKIMLLPADSAGEKLCSYAEQLLTEIAVAFSHRIVIVREKIGARSVQAYGAALTEETVEQCRACTGVICGNANAEGLDELCACLEMPLRVRSVYLPAAAGVIQPPFYVARVLGQSAALLNKAVKQAMKLAREKEMPLTWVSPVGRSANDFVSAVNVVKENFPDVRAVRLDAPSAMSLIVEQPQNAGVVLVPAYVGSIFAAAGASLCPMPGFLREFAPGKMNGVHAPVQPNVMPNADEASPIGMAYAVADLLRDTLHLETEADCLECAIENALTSGFVTRDMQRPGTNVNGEGMTGVILRQIELAGSILH